MKVTLSRIPLWLPIACLPAYIGLGLLVASLLSPALRAQTTITFSSPTAVSGPGDIATTGSFHAAIGATAANVTVSGVTFATSSPLITIFDASPVNSTMGAFSSGNANYDALINRGYASTSANTPYVELSGLTVGSVYRIQFWTPAWISNLPTQIFHGPATDISFQFGNTATAPTYAVGTFTATSSTGGFGFANADGFPNGLLSAIAVYDVTAIPEPSTYAAIAGLGALGLAFWRRRSRRAADGVTG